MDGVPAPEASAGATPGDDGRREVAPGATGPTSPDVDVPELDDRTRVVCFSLGGRDLLVDVTTVQEVLVAGAITRLPGSPAAVAGVTSVRGRIVAVVDASTALGTDPPQARDRFLVVATPGGPVALVVDRVDAVVPADLQPVDGAPGTSPLVVATATIAGSILDVVDPVALIEAAVAATSEAPGGDPGTAAGAEPAVAGTS